MKLIRKKKRSKDGFPNLELGIQKWEVGVMLLGVLLVVFLAYLICNL